MVLSFIIPTYNRAALLAPLLEALAGQRTAEDVAFEAIFVDNGSTDSTPEVLNEAVRKDPDRLRCIRIAPTGGPSAPRNTGIRAAAGDALIFIDDDFIPDPDLVLRYAAFHAQHPGEHHAAVGATYVPDHLRDDPMSVFRAFDYSQLRNPDRLDYMHFWTRNASVKRAFMLRAGMFDESFLYYEDVLCARRMAASGLHLHFWRSATGQHLHPVTLKTLAIRARFIGRWSLKFLEAVGPDSGVTDRLQLTPDSASKRGSLTTIFERSALWVADHPAALWFAGKLLGRMKRSSRTDHFLNTIFHENFVASYREVKRDADAHRPTNLLQLQSSVADRGEGDF